MLAAFVSTDRVDAAMASVSVAIVEVTSTLPHTYEYVCPENARQQIGQRDRKSSHIERVHVSCAHRDKFYRPGSPAEARLRGRGPRQWR